MNTFKTTIAGKPVICDINLQGFDLHKKASTNVDYFGIHKAAGQLFIQFNNGKCYVYSGVDENTLQDAVEAESIGKYYYAQVKGKFAEQHVTNRAIQPDVEEEDDELSEIDLDAGWPSDDDY